MQCTGKSLNPYSTGSNSNTITKVMEFVYVGLNPYSTGSNSNSLFLS